MAARTDKEPWVVAGGRTGCAGCALALAVWGGLPVWGLAGLTLVIGTTLARALLPIHPRRGWPPRGFAVAWIGTLMVWGSAGSAAASRTYWDGYFALAAALVAAALLPVRWATDARRPPCGWRGLTWGWACLAVILWLGSGYRQNHRTAFVLALVCGAGLLLLGRYWFRLPTPALHLVHGLILFLLALPLADLAWRASATVDPEAGDPPYSYETAHHSPAAFRRWWRYYLAQWNLMAADVFDSDPSGLLPLRLRAGAQGRLMRSTIRINRHGFRGPELQNPEEAVYRIVVLGESTTFGCTLETGDRPWPELLEDLIRERLNPPRPVEVINAGIPGLTLEHNVLRLPNEILRLRPDMILSYHGYNGFSLLRPAVARPADPLPPPYPQRPLALLAQAEYAWRMRRFRAHPPVPRVTEPRPTPAGPQQTAYAQAYRNLIQTAQSNGIKLGLANFSMAVNPHSDLGVVQFYRAAFPSVQWSVAANEVHTRLVTQLTRDFPEVIAVDTHPGLEGQHAKFIDLVHLTQEGRQQLAENVYRSLAKVLPREWASDAQSNPGSAATP